MTKTALGNAAAAGARAAPLPALSACRLWLHRARAAARRCEATPTASADCVFGLGFGFAAGGGAASILLDGGGLDGRLADLGSALAVPAWPPRAGLVITIMLDTLSPESGSGSGTGRGGDEAEPDGVVLGGGRRRRSYLRRSHRDPRLDGRRTVGGSNGQRLGDRLWRRRFGDGFSRGFDDAARASA